MTNHTLGILIGGIVPCIMFVVANTSAKAASLLPISTGWYMVFVGIGVLLAGCIALLLGSRQAVSPAGISLGLLVGLAWGTGIGFLVHAMTRYGSPISVLTPLFNMNTLFTVLLGLWLFAEWKQVKVPQLVLGSLLIVAGGTLVAKS